MQISELSTRELSDLIYTKLSVIRDDNTNLTDVVLQTPTTSSKFPCRVINVPLEQIVKTDNAVPVVTRYQVTIENWAKLQRDAMDMGNRTDIALRDINFTRTTTTPVIFDEVTKNYRLIATYELIYYGVHNSFEVVR